MCEGLLKYISRVVTDIQSGLLYLFVVVALALLSLAFLVYEWLPQADPQIVDLGTRLDLVVAYVFLTDFFLGLFFNTHYKNKREYWRSNWLDFISAIPISNEVTHALRILRLWRAIRVIQVILNVIAARKQAKFTKEIRQKIN